MDQPPYPRKTRWHDRPPVTCARHACTRFLRLKTIMCVERIIIPNYGSWIQCIICLPLFDVVLGREYVNDKRTNRARIQLRFGEGCWATRWLFSWIRNTRKEAFDEHEKIGAYNELRA